jgi:hypothetical protein
MGIYIFTKFQTYPIKLTLPKVSNFNLSPENLDNDLKIEDTNEGELFEGDGDERRMQLKQKETTEKLKYDFKPKQEEASSSKSPKNLYQGSVSGNISRENIGINYGDNLNRNVSSSSSSEKSISSNAASDDFERRLEEKARKMREILSVEEKKELSDTSSSKHNYFGSSNNNSSRPQPTSSTSSNESGAKLRETSNRPETKIVSGSSSNPIPKSTTGSMLNDYEGSRPIDADTAKDLRMLIFGNLTQTFNQEWLMQNLAFGDIAKLKFGIVQKKGGPCGVLAAIQAYVLLELLFPSNSSNSEQQPPRDLNLM